MTELSLWTVKLTAAVVPNVTSVAFGRLIPSKVTVVPPAAEPELAMPKLALAWGLRREIVSSAIIGVTRTEQLEDNIRASGVELPEETLAKIDAIAPGPAQ